MDFFAAQDHARRASRWLVGWFAAAVLAIVLVVYVVLALALNAGELPAAGAPPPSLWQPQLLLLTAVGVGGFILLGSVYKILVLARGGGAAVATALGGRLVPRASSDPLERRLINVVDEMAIAAGMPAPPAYILDAEQGINAFAAGSRSTEGVVAVTRGALEKLSRDQLQGVIAHEFSHILNGDMRLNLRLIGVLHGILLLTLIGRVLMRSAQGSDKGAAPVLLGGLSLVVIGYIGIFFGKLIKAAVSRQREFLADAAAVQFTRNPAGIAGALRQIGGYGSGLSHPRAEEASHMFFGSGLNLSRLYATHPPLAERIRRLDPAFDPGRMPPDEAGEQDDSLQDSPGDPGIALETNDAPQTLLSSHLASAAPLSPQALAAEAGSVRPEHLDYARQLIASLPQALHEAVHRPGGAQAVVFALLLADDPDTRQAQLDTLRTRHGEQVVTHCAQVRAAVQQAGPALRLPLLDLTLPALRELSAEARRSVLESVGLLIRADARITLFEFALQRLLRRALNPRNRLIPPGLLGPARLRADCALLFSALARAGHGDEMTVEAAFSRAARLAPLDGAHPLSASAGLKPEQMDAALDRLAATAPAFRKRVVEACAAAVLHDGRVTAGEHEMLRTVCEALDCPLPPLPALAA